MNANEIRCEKCTERHCNGCKNHSHFSGDNIKVYPWREFRIFPGYVYAPYTPIIQFGSGASS
jgi:hypothetical protein